MAKKNLFERIKNSRSKRSSEAPTASTAVGQAVFTTEQVNNWSAMMQQARAANMGGALAAERSVIQVELESNPWYVQRALGLEVQNKAAGTAVAEMPSREMLKRVPVPEVQTLDFSDELGALATEAERLLGYSGLSRMLKVPGRLRQALAKLELEVLDECTVDQFKMQMAAHYAEAGKMIMPTWRLMRLENYSMPVPEFVLAKAIEIKRELPEANFYIDQLAVDPFLIVSLYQLHDWSVNTTRELDAERAAYLDVWAEPKFEAKM